MCHEQAIVHSDPKGLGGTPVFTGTRVPVGSLVAHLRDGISLTEFLEATDPEKRTSWL
ncbi:MAG: hypothetical protein COV99_03610 [Bacteroidetes bacterium CG12_big_fil_rev_8_21_14_0_65_60_17]|nr:MAG: hypothetical protein COV99_03610 [Bacteroidetes bacterium CG12_big_fil_rev_8_21_14_0_65_60_17]